MASDQPAFPTPFVFPCGLLLFRCTGDVLLACSFRSVGVDADGSKLLFIYYSFTVRSLQGGAMREDLSDEDVNRLDSVRKQIWVAGYSGFFIGGAWGLANCIIYKARSPVVERIANARSVG